MGAACSVFNGGFSLGGVIKLTKCRIKRIFGRIRNKAHIHWLIANFFDVAQQKTHVLRYLDTYMKRYLVIKKGADFKAFVKIQYKYDRWHTSFGGQLMLNKLLSISEPWLQYAIKLNLLNESKDDLVDLKNEGLKDKKIKLYIAEISDFHNKLVRNHKDPDLSVHKLLFLLDAGLGTDIPEIESAIQQIMNHKDSFGVYQSLTNIPPHYGGKGEDVFGWCLCDAPLLLLALLKAKMDYQQHIKQGVEHLLALYTEQGFPCSVSEEHGKFRGPGRKDDCCPYATFIMLNLLSEVDEYRNSDTVKKGIEVILTLWENSRERHPYMFYMGTDFRKLKAPALWYDIVSVADCLSKFEFAKADPRFCEMTDLIKGKQDADGMFTPESVYQKCKGWDFGQKKTVSPYLSYLCIRLLKRIHD